MEQFGSKITDVEKCSLMLSPERRCQHADEKMAVTIGRQAEGKQSKSFTKEDAMKLKNFAVIGLVLVGAVGAVISFMVFAAIINGTPGDDTISDNPGNDVIRAFEGDDDITVTNGGNDRVDAGDDDDQIEIQVGAGRVYVVGGEGHDVIDASAGANHRIFGNDGDDNILLGTGVRGARVEAGDGDDVIDVNVVAGNVVIYGGDGDDEIEGIDATGNLKVYGGSGVDNITLGAGSNFVEPGEDADVVVAGTDATSRDVINIRVGDVPAGETEKITCTVDDVNGATTTIILKRNSLGAFPPGTPTQFAGQDFLNIIDPLTGGVYEIRQGNGDGSICRIVRR
jgi:Ca2+-binding RTX toxin-like protein